MSYPRMVEFEPTTKPMKKPLKERLQDFIFNEESNTILGRTPDSWAKLIVFYVIFYGALAALVAFCMWAFFQTLDPRTPTLRLEQSLIGGNPGLGFRPRPPEKDVESTLIYYKGTKDEDFAYWKNDLVEFLKVYRYPGLTPGRGQNIDNCEYGKPPKKGRVCDMDVKGLDPCTEENKFNFHKSGPCIFLKLNKIYGWIPEYYNQTNELPEEMPAQLKEHIASEGRKNAKYLNTVWISCEGENPADVENIGRIAYYPWQGFPGYFYPYENSEGYLSPLVALHIEQPTNGIIINIECKAWAKNIRHNRQERIGLVHFELMMD